MSGKAEPESKMEIVAVHPLNRFTFDPCLKLCCLAWPFKDLLFGLLENQHQV